MSDILKAAKAELIGLKDAFIWSFETKPIQTTFELILLISVFLFMILVPIPTHKKQDNKTN